MRKEWMGMGAARRAILVPVIVGFTAFCGCGDSGIKYEHANVHGKITYRGKPLTFGTILFMPVEVPKEGTIQPASGAISADGTYELTSQTTSGAILGEHKVMVIAVEGGKIAPPPATAKDGVQAPVAATKGSKDLQLKSSVPKKYSDPMSTPLTRKVVAGDNAIDIELTD
jgi:hypothetical protein